MRRMELELLLSELAIYAGSFLLVTAKLWRESVFSLESRKVSN